MAGGPKTYADLSDAAVAFLSDIDAIDAAMAMAARFGARDAQALLSLAEDVALGEVAFSDIPRKLQEQGVPPEKSREAAVAFATERLLPIAGEVGDVAGAIASWGGDVSKLPAGMDAKSMAASGIAGFLASRGVKMPSDVLQKRLEFQLSGFLSGERDEAAAVAMMTRPSKVGGLDMVEADARALLKEVAQRKPVVQAKPGPKPVEVKPTDLGSAPLHRQADVKPRAEQPKLAKEPVSQSQKPKETAQSTEVKPRGGLTSVPAQVAAAAGITDPELLKRLELAVDARMKDVRDAFETRALFEQPKDKGGLGISGASLAAAMEALEAAVAKKGAELDAAAAQGKASALASGAKAREEKEKAARAAEEAALSKRYAELTGVATDMPLSAPMASMKAAAAARVSAATVPPAPGRPKLDDVRFARRLAGPVDELRALTMADFRRLSKDPSEAARKVKAKVALLEEQGYEQKIAAIKAWRESAVHRLYVALSQEALGSGKPVSQVAAERRKAMPEMFSPEELAAVIGLNGELRF